MNKYLNTIKDINVEYDKFRELSDDELRSRSRNLEYALNSDKSKCIDNILVQAYALVKETARRFSEGGLTVVANEYDRILAEKYDFVKIDGDKAIYRNHWDAGGVPMQWNMVHYDEQLLGGIYLHYGYAVEMATGEGKTLVATLPVFLNALTHQGVHIMTANDYLSRRDFETTRPIYMFHGLTADCIEYYDRNDFRRKEAYKADITFGTNSSFTFDYLFDHIAILPSDCVQQSHNFAIIDELDSILIDEAGEPHIVSGGNFYNDGEIYKNNISTIKEIVNCEDKSLYTVDRLHQSACFTQNGKKLLAEKSGVPDLYSIERTYEIADYDKLPIEGKKEIQEKLHLQNVFNQLLHALTVYEKDVDYVVEEGKIKIVDHHTGRIKESNRWEYGLHTAIEVKEDVEVQDDFDGMAVISLKNYFRLYNKIAGMSGTIMPVKEELLELYGLKCSALPTHKPVIRRDEPLRVFRTSALKDQAIANLIAHNISVGRPTLVGSISIKRSEEIGDLLDSKGIKFNKLDAKTTKDEALIVAKAGVGCTVTVSTSVAGRGTDIKPSDDALANGGLMVIGTDLFDSIRVDRQLRGRSGRQGNPGSSVFFSSLDDFILNNLSDQDKDALNRLVRTTDEDELSSSEVRAFFEKAQSNRELYFKEQRKKTAEKDDIIAPRRKKFYDQRNSVLFDAKASEGIVNKILIQSNNTNFMDIEKHVNSLYYKAKELLVRSRKNNINRQNVYIPFTDNLHPFAILLDVDLAITNVDYFVHEFKRQVILQIYDKFWKKFVLHMMGDLDAHEISLLDKEYEKMMAEINQVILSRLSKSNIPFEERVQSNDLPTASGNDVVKPVKSYKSIQAESLCPCGSGKKFCECHGNNIRRINRGRRR